MNNCLDNDLNEAMQTLELLINSEHKELILDVLSLYVRKKEIEPDKMSRASEALNIIIAQ